MPRRILRTFSTKALFFSGILITLLAGSPLPAEDFDLPRAILFSGLSEQDTVTLKPNGEIQVHPADAQWFSSEELFQVSVVFKNADNYEKALSSPYFRTKKAGLHLADFGVVVFRDSSGVQILSDEKTDVSLTKLLKEATEPFCSDIAVRGFVELAPELYMAINIHRRPIFPDFTSPTTTKSLPPEHCRQQCTPDAFNNCPTFAIISNCDSSCVNFCENRDCSFTVFRSRCERVPIPILPDTCDCRV